MEIDLLDITLTLFLGGWNSTDSIIQTCVKSIPIFLCALAVAVPGKYGLINLGAEGQLIIGAICASIIPIYFNFNYLELFTFIMKFTT